MHSIMKSTKCKLPENHVFDSEEVLDLHGYTKEKAIKRLYFFLDQVRRKHLSNISAENFVPSTMVEIITGSGKHSQSGPVLRQAVEKVLQERQMTFRLNRGKGSFTVDALSGVDELQTPVQYPTDSKVLLQKNQGVSKDLKLINRPRNALVNQEHSDSDIQRVSEFNSMPTPSEAMQEEKQIEDAKQLSIRQASEYASIQAKESGQFKQAIAESMAVHREWENEDRKAIMDALELSKKQEEVQTSICPNTSEDEEAMLQLALDLSKVQK